MLSIFISKEFSVNTMLLANNTQLLTLFFRSFHTEKNVVFLLLIQIETKLIYIVLNPTHVPL